ncbi:DNA integrity scanning protein DisA [Candidatus Pacearchaeota archaeon]|nr:DNA integrity scanning protein DisA [Candidatus Pacearchaeota archaeon]
MEKEQAISKEEEKKAIKENEEGSINANNKDDSKEEEKKEKEDEKEKTSKHKKGKDEKRKTILDMIKFVVPGTSLRNAVINIVKGGHGALIVLGSSKMQELFEGGFRVNCRFTEQRLTELSKMDGAIILSDDLKRILYANTLLIPSTEIATDETGTRHKAAERTAKQAETFVIAISERRKQTTLYYKDQRHVLKDSDEILRRATETLQILEKERDVFENLMNNFNILEITNLVYARDVCSLLQKIEVIIRMEKVIKRYLLEMGNEGIIVKMRLKELVKNIEKEGGILLKDYAPSNQKRLNTILSHLNYEGLLDIETLSRLLFEMHPDDTIAPRGYRMLNKTNLAKGELKNIINYFGNLNLILNANLQQLKEALKSEKRAETLQKELSSVKEQLLTGRKI